MRMIAVELEGPPPALTFRLCDELWISSNPISILPDLDPEDIVITAIEPPDDELGSSLSPPEEMLMTTSAVHFLSDDSEKVVESSLDESNSSSSFELTLLQQTRRDLLEYLLQDDGSVVCKWCGEVLPSRTHWYRHKYKQHTNAPPGTNNLYKCKLCNVFFKSRKGYTGHLSSRHNESATPTPTTATPTPDQPSPPVNDNSGRLDATPTSTAAKVRRSSSCGSGTPAAKGVSTCVEEYKKRRENEDKLVKEIFDRVRKECEAQGTTEGRRGYTRRTTVMNT